MNTGIYKITSVSGKSYIGSAVNIRTRWNSHRKLLRQRKHHSRHLQRAWDKHGEENFEFSKLLICSKSDLIFFEQRAIDVIGPEYNICKIAGSSIGLKRTEKMNKRNSLVRLGVPRGPHSLEHRQRISESAKRRGVIPPSQKGRIRSLDHCRKISENAKSRALTKEGRRFLLEIGERGRATKSLRAKEPKAFPQV